MYVRAPLRFHVRVLLTDSDLHIAQELRGNIRVYVRAKPLSDEETATGVASVVRCENDHRVSCIVGGSTKVTALPPIPALDAVRSFCYTFKGGAVWNLFSIGLPT